MRALVDEVPTHAPMDGQWVDGAVWSKEHVSRARIDVVDAYVYAASLDVKVGIRIDDGIVANLYAGM